MQPLSLRFGFSALALSSTIAAIMAGSGCGSNADALNGSGGSSGSSGSSLPGSADPGKWTGGSPKGSVPMSGGTLLVTADGRSAVAADPDRDLMYVVDLATHSLSHQIALPVGAEPGRVVEDGNGRAHVILRRGGGIADIDVATGSLLGLRQVCALPRGIAYRATDGALLVTCLTGALVTMSSDPTVHAPLASATLSTAAGPLTDLRDVLVSGSSVYVTTFRSAQVFQVGTNQVVSLHTRVDTIPPEVARLLGLDFTTQNYIPNVAWRAALNPAGDVVVVHQAGTDRAVDVQIHPSEGDGGASGPDAGDGGLESPPDGGGSSYGGSNNGGVCVPSISISAVSTVSSSGTVTDGPVLPNGALPVDIAATPDGRAYVVALAGNPRGTVDSNGRPLPNVLSIAAVSQNNSGSGGNGSPFGGSNLCGQGTSMQGASVPGQVSSVALDRSGRVLAQTREPAALQYFTGDGVVSIPLSPVSVANEGFDLFHTNTGTGMTCAGCHAEGQDDGRTWKFTTGVDGVGMPVNVELRRTQTFRQGFLDTAPFHWSGQFVDMPSLILDVLVGRMGAKDVPTDEQEIALEAWMNAIPKKMHDAPSPALAASIAAGQALFFDSTVGCSTCHSGANFTNNQNMDIGFGVALQVPTLIDVGFRAPYLHDGSAATLAARFSDATARSGKHGQTAQLSPAQIDDLIAYLQSL
jgi:mono/diheme cytochrome c family protein